MKTYLLNLSQLYTKIENIGHHYWSQLMFDKKNWIINFEKFLSLEHMEKNQNKYCLKLRNIHEIRDSVFRKHVPDARKYSLRTDFTQLWNGSSNIPLYVAQGVGLNSGGALVFLGLSDFFNFSFIAFLKLHSLKGRNQNWFQPIVCRVKRQSDRINKVKTVQVNFVVNIVLN